MMTKLVEYSVEQKPGQTGVPTRTLEQRIEDFWGYVKKCEGDGCWEWSGSVTSFGYGQIKINHQMWRTHRISWILAYGEIPVGSQVCHKCDNAKCVRPDHLFLGTGWDNMRDMINKGRARHPSGENQPMSKHSQKTINLMLTCWATGKVTKAKLGKHFNIPRGSVGLIVKGKIWKDSKADEHTPEIDRLVEEINGRFRRKANQTSFKSGKDHPSYTASSNAAM